MSYPLITAVSFERTPVPEIGPKWMELHALGWEWQENLPPRWIARFKRVYPDSHAAKGAEAEVQRVMGDYYVSADELEAGAADASQPLP